MKVMLRECMMDCVKGKEDSFPYGSDCVFSYAAMMAYAKEIGKPLYCYVGVPTYFEGFKRKQIGAVLYDERDPRHRLAYAAGRYVFISKPIAETKTPYFSDLFYSKSDLVRRGTRVTKETLSSSDYQHKVFDNYFECIDNDDQAMANVVIALGNKAAQRGFIGIAEVDVDSFDEMKIDSLLAYDALVVCKQEKNGAVWMTIDPYVVYGKGTGL